MFIQWLTKPVKFDQLDQWLKIQSVRILDVGCGNHSPSTMKKYYPACRYYGIDQSRTYNLDEADFKAMEEFYEIDLAKTTNFDMLQNDFFDCIILNHVIEHVEKGDEIVFMLISKLKQGGIIYVEFPSPRSAHLPKMKGTLNFYDDPTHVRLYDLNKLIESVNKLGCESFKSGTRRSLKRILLLPAFLVGSLIQFGHVRGVVFWDILGFAQYFIARKK